MRDLRILAVAATMVVACAGAFAQAANAASKMQDGASRDIHRQKHDAQVSSPKP
jgi:hypothetical protein